MELTAQSVSYEFYTGVAYITLASPQSGNALNHTLLEQLAQAIRQAGQDESCRVITLLAEGPDFCKGLDLQWAFVEAQPKIPEREFTYYTNCLTQICNCALPVVAVVEGNVTAGGLGLVAACDIVLAEEQTRFILSEVIVGMLPALVTPFLLRRLSLAQVRYLTLSTRELTALEAQSLGLVDEVVRGDINKTLDKQLQRLLRSSPQAIAASKRYFTALAEGKLPQQLNIARDTLAGWLDQPEVVAGIRDFAEGLAPPWFQKYKQRKK